MAIKFLNSVNADSGVLYVDAANDRVGIGTTGPSTKLEVSGDTQVVTIRTSYPSDSSQRGAFLWKDSTNITGAIDTRYDGTTVDMHFGSLYNSGYNSTTRLVIKGNGNVGIGTTSPTRTLHVAGTGRFTDNLYSTSTDVDGIKTRFLSGAANNSTNNGTLYLQYGKSNPVSIGETGSSDLYVAGNVGIGTTSPAQKLDVVGRVRASYDANNYYEIGASSSGGFVVGKNGGTETVNIRTYGDSHFTGGNFGIGTTAPNALLSISKTISSDTRFLEINNAGNNQFRSDIDFTVTSGGITVGRISSIYPAGNNVGLSFSTYGTSPSTGLHERMRINGSDGNVGIGTTDPTSRLSIKGTQAAIDITRGNTGDSKWEFSSDSTALYFSEMSTGTRAYMMTIKETSGNVGIGTTSPVRPLHIHRSATSTDVRISLTDGTTGAGTDSGFDIIKGTGQNAYLWNYSNASMRFGTNASERMRITNTGNVGIGTTNPVDKLDVSGQITQIGSGDYHSVTCTARFSEGGVTLSRSGAGYVGAYPYKNIDSFTASVAFKTTTATHLGIGFRADDADADDNNYAVILRNNSPTDTEVRVQKRVNGTQTYPISAVNVTTDCDDGGWHTLTVSFNGSHIIVYVDNTKYIDEAWTDTSFTDPGLVGLAIYDGTTVFSDFSVIETKALLLELDDRYVNVTGDTMSGDLNFEDSNGNTRLTIGNIIGSPYEATVNSSNYHLVLQAKGTGQGQIRFKTGTSSATEKMRILENGNVGIGTASPSEKLHVSGNVRIEGDLTVNGSYTQIDTDVNTTEQWNVTNDGTGPAVTINQTGAQDIMDVQDDGTSVFYIEDGGNVGLGTTNPDTKLEISGASGQKIRIKSTKTSLAADELVGAFEAYKTDGSTNGPGVFGSLNIYSQDLGGASYVTLNTSASDGNNVERLRIKSNGSVLLSSYGNNNFTGTAAYALAVDSSGNVIETSYIPSSSSTDFVAVAGDTMTGKLTISSSEDHLLIDNTASDGSARIRFKARSDRDAGPYIKSTARGSTSADSDIRIGDENGDIATFNGGNVGIGTASPNARLNVKSTGSTTDQITLTHSGNTVNIVAIGQESSHGSILLRNNSGVNKVRLSAAGNNSYILDSNLGIGTTSPAFTLDVNGKIRVGTVTSQSPATLISRRNGANIEFGHGNTSSGYYGTIGVQGNNGQPYFALSAECESSVNTFTTRGFKGNVITTDGAGSLMFSQLTSANATGQSLTERMRITAAGNVGIGTSNPVSHSQNRRTLVVSDTTDGANVEIWGNGSGGKSILQSVGGNTYVGNLANGNGAGTTFITSGAGNTYTTILANGNVGIGTTNPTAKLTVQGDDADIFLRSNDYTIARLINRGSTGVSLDTGLFSLFTSDGTTNNVEKIRLDAGGYSWINSSNVGIGTTTPNAMLDVNKTTIGEYAYFGSGATRQLRLSSYNTTSDHAGHKINASSGNGEITLATNSVAALTVKNDQTVQLNAYGAGYLKSDASGNITVDSDTIEDTLDSVTDRGNTTTNDIEVGNITTKNDSGIYSFSDTVNASSSEDIFSISNNHGAQAFRVAFVCSTSAYSVAKTFEVVHSYGNAPVFFKVVDTGAYGTHDFDVSFTNDATDDSKVVCSITNNSTTVNASIVSTVFLGGSPTAITVTAL